MKWIPLALVLLLAGCDSEGNSELSNSDIADRWVGGVTLNVPGDCEQVTWAFDLLLREESGRVFGEGSLTVSTNHPSIDDCATNTAPLSDIEGTVAAPDFIIHFTMEGVASDLGGSFALRLTYSGVMSRDKLSGDITYREASFLENVVMTRR